MSVTVRPHCQLSYLFLARATKVAAKNLENGMLYNHATGTVDMCVNFNRKLFHFVVTYLKRLVLNLVSKYYIRLVTKSSFVRE